MDNCALKCIVTGMARSGTTVVSRTLMSHPDYFGGFECGLLLRPLCEFHKSQPFYDWMQRSTAQNHWGVSADNLKKIMAADSYPLAYDLLLKHSGDHGPRRIKELYQATKYIIDKTPAYIHSLKDVMKRIDIPVIVIHKTVHDQYISEKKRFAKIKVKQFCRRVFNLCIECSEANGKFPNRILFVNFDDFLSDNHNTIKLMSNHIGMTNDLDISIENYFKKISQYKNSADKVGEYDMTKLITNKPKIRLSSFELKHLDDLAIKLKDTFG